jgi:hypothetical protein
MAKLGALEKVCIITRAIYKYVCVCMYLYAHVRIWYKHTFRHLCRWSKALDGYDQRYDNSYLSTYTFLYVCSLYIYRNARPSHETLLDHHRRSVSHFHSNDSQQYTITIIIVPLIAAAATGGNAYVA